MLCRRMKKGSEHGREQMDVMRGSNGIHMYDLVTDVATCRSV